MAEKGIVFGKGFLGTRIAQELGYDSVGREVDVTNFDSVRSFLDFGKPPVVINAIGKTGGPGAIGIDWCETHQEETFESNVVVPRNLAIACSDLGIYFVHLGSGCIYRGNNNGQGFSEQDTPNFNGHQFYAQTKIMAEQSLRGLPGLNLRIRMPIDDSPHPRNLVDKLKSYERVIVVPNSMTTIPHALPVIKSLIERRRQGTYNLVNPGTITASRIMSLYQQLVDPSHFFTMMTLDELNSITKARRSNCVLSTEKLKSEGLEMPPIDEAVKQCLTRYREHLK